MADLISREAALAILHECGGDEITTPNMIEMRGRMHRLPAVDAVEVVRCKDCRWKMISEDAFGIDDLEPLCECMFMPEPHRHYEYCSQGKRREENAAD